MDDDKKQLPVLNRRIRFTQFLVWIALFFTAIGIAAGYKNWLRIHDKAKNNVVAVAEIREQLSTFVNKQNFDVLNSKVKKLDDDNKDYIEHSLRDLRNIQTSTKHIADTVYDQIETLTLQQNAATNNWIYSKPDWSLAEIHFLLQTANQSLQLKQDKSAAIFAFKQADQLLIKKGLVDLLPLRKQISHDIALVMHYELADVPRLLGVIDSLLEQLKPLSEEPEKTSKAPEDLINITALEEKEASIVTRIKKSINNAVVVKRFDEPLQSEMDTISKDRLFQLLSLRLETLRLLLLQNRDKTYHAQIERIRIILKKYYPKSQYVLFNEALKTLDTANLTPQKPDVSGSLNLLDKLIPQLNKNN